MMHHMLAYKSAEPARSWRNRLANTTANLLRPTASRLDDMLASFDSGRCSLARRPPAAWTGNCLKKETKLVYLLEKVKFLTEYTRDRNEFTCRMWHTALLQIIACSPAATRPQPVRQPWPRQRLNSSYAKALWQAASSVRSTVTALMRGRHRTERKPAAATGNCLKRGIKYNKSTTEKECQNFNILLCTQETRPRANRWNLRCQ